MTTKKSSPIGASAIPTVPASTGTPTVTTSPVAVIPRTGFEDVVQEMMQGFEKVLPAGSTLPGAGGGYSQATVVAQLQSVLTLYAAVATAKQASSQAVANLRAAVPGAQVLIKALKAAVVGYFGPGAPQLAEFGIVEKPRTKPSSLQDAVKAAKAKQTRLANGTLGKKQKAKAALAVEVQTVLAPQQSATPSATAKPTTSGQ
jgi:hypothetical protein